MTTKNESGFELRKAWSAFSPEGQPESIFLEFCRRATSLGEALLAYDIAQKGLAQFPNSILIKQKAALAQARGGSPTRAIDILEPLLEEEEHLEDTYGILARAYKDLWEKSHDPHKKNEYGKKSQELYAKGFEKSEGYYTGLNSATMLLFLGESHASKLLAEKITSICTKLLSDSSNDYWLIASLAEAQLISGKVDEAALSYRAALQLNGIGPAEIASTRKQALAIAKVMGVESKISPIFRIPSVIVFSGHMVDHPNRPQPRFPAENEAQARTEIEEHLTKMNAGFGYSSAACGGDIIFIEAMLDRGAEVHIVLPFEKEDFIKESVVFAGGNWRQRFEKALKKATSVTYATEEKYLGDTALFELCNQMIEGLGLIRAKSVEANTELLLLWDGKNPQARGGTAAFAEKWELRFSQMKRIDPMTQPEVSNKTKPQGSPLDFGPPKLAVKTPRVIKTLLFADVVGYSKLSESQLPSFNQEYLQPVAKSLKQEAKGLVSVNTWGDGLYCVFDELEQGADWALKFRDLVRGTQWSNCGLPKDFNVRISLHIGPVFTLEDPIIEQPAYFGTHVARVARIEPITTPGCVFGTEQVAALLNASSSPLRCDYVGTISLAKRYGLYPIYQIRREGDLE